MSRTSYPRLILFFGLISSLYAISPLLAQSKTLGNLKFMSRDYVLSWPDGCEPQEGNNDCSYIRFTYDVLLTAPNIDLVRKVNRFTYQILSDVQEASSSAALEQVAQSFIEDKKSEENQRGVPWTEDRQASLSLKGKVLSVNYSTIGYTGGAHGFGFFENHHFHTETTEKIKLDDFFKPGYLPPLLTIAEKAFRETQQIKPHENLSDYGYSFPDGTFALSDFFELREQGIEFGYNRYEIGPYIVPPSFFFLSFEDIAHLLKENNLLGVPTRFTGGIIKPAQTECRFSFVGTLANNSITMCFYPDENYGDVSGHYYYGDGSAGVLSFEGKAYLQKDGSYVQRLEERNNKGVLTGVFEGFLFRGVMQGTWKNADGSRSFPYRLTLQK